MSGIVIEGLGQQSGGGGPQPTLISVTPSWDRLVLTFSEPMLIESPLEQPQYWSITGAAPAITITSVEVSGATITVFHTETLAGQPATLSIPVIGLKDASTDPYAGPFTYNFTTAGQGPQIYSIESVEGRLVRLIFDEPVQESTAIVTANYSADNGLSIISVVKDNPRTYLLTTSLQTPGTTYTVTINNIKDTAGNAI